MSDLEKYRKEKVYLAEVCAAGTLEDLADAAIAELEAELATEREHPTSILQCAACQRLAVVQNVELAARAELAEADLARVADGFGTLAAQCAELEALRARVAESEVTIERLKCCGNCEHHEYWGDGEDCKAVNGAVLTACFDPCHFAPSRWTERSTP